jgi:hypothetical protein
MALTNAENQARWRERHIRERRYAQRLANLLMRKRRTEETIEDIAVVLNLVFNRRDITTLRRKLKDLTGQQAPDWAKRDLPLIYELLATEREAWERDHPGEDYPEHPCGLSDRESTDLTRWKRQRQRRATSVKH